MKTEREIEMLIRKTEQKIKTIRPTIKSMGSPEARKVERLEGKVEAFKEVLNEEKKEYVDITIGDHGTHTIVSDDESVITSGTININHTN